MLITFATLRRVAPIGVTVIHEERLHGGTYRATAPDGYRFEEGPHELVAYWGRRSGSADDARRDLFERLIEAVISRCDDPDCSSCWDPTVA